MKRFPSSVLSCAERERLEQELAEARERGRYLTRLRNLTPAEQALLERHERAAQQRLREHDAEHGCQR